MPKPAFSTLRRTVTACAGVVCLALTGVALASPAAAHVTASSDVSSAGSYAVVTFSVPHGCDGSPTSAISIHIPEGVNSVTPTRSSYYSVTKTTEALDPPATDAHGNQVTERVAEVVYTAIDPLPDGYRDTFQLSLQIPADAAGTTLYFPTVQTCESGESAWIQIPADGQDADDLELPAPSLTVTESSEHGDDHGAASGSPAEVSADTSGSSEGSATGLSIVALVVGGLGLLAGGFALVRGGRRTT